MKLAGIILVILGGVLFLAGLVFKIQHWPGAGLGLSGGPLVFALGILLILQGSKSNRNSR